MDLKFVERLLKLLAESDADEIEIEEEGKRIKVARHSAPAPAPREFVLPVAAGQPPTSAAPPPAVSPAVTSAHHEIKSPIVGTFYRAPAPDSAPFIEIGSLVHSGTVLCIVEAMKLMNEIESDVEGKIVKILVENGQPIEYDQPLFLIEKS